MSTFRKLTLAVLCGLFAACGGPQEDKDDKRSPPGLGLKENLPGSQSEQAAFRLAVEWLEGPAISETNRCRLVFFDKQGQAAHTVSGVKLKQWMKSMNHGAATIDLELSHEAERADAVLVSGLYFSMGGPWELLVSATVNGTTDKIEYAVEVPK